MGTGVPGSLLGPDSPPTWPGGIRAIGRAHPPPEVGCPAGAVPLGRRAATAGLHGGSGPAVRMAAL
eukprot:3772601-Alexandrium_andersonii.AAC.1